MNFVNQQLFASGVDAPAIMRPLETDSAHELDEEQISELSKALDGDDDLDILQPSLKSLSLVDGKKAFQLFTSEERLLIRSPEQFTRLLKCSDDFRLKVVSVFGHSGDGKSHLLNQILFNGWCTFEVGADSGGGVTRGAWCALQPAQRLLAIDTEGLHSRRPNTMRMLLKMLAISDVVIIVSRWERGIGASAESFVRGAGLAWGKHLAARLAAAGHPAALRGPLSHAGPAVIFSHRTTNTRPIPSSPTESAEDVLRARLGPAASAFSGLRYVGTRATSSSSTDGASEEQHNQMLIRALKDELDNTAVRSPRTPAQVFSALSVLNSRFTSDTNGTTIAETSLWSLPMERCLACHRECVVCQVRCQLSMDHIDEGVDHCNDDECVTSDNHNNWWWECTGCGSQTNSGAGTGAIWLLGAFSWGQNSNPLCQKCNHGTNTLRKTRKRAAHVWSLRPSNRSLRMSSVVPSSSLATITGAIRANAWAPLADAMAPDYWQPTADCKKCAVCRRALDAGGCNSSEDASGVHHCRSCGQGVCGACSTTRAPVPQRGFVNAVRICDHCLTPASLPVVASTSPRTPQIGVTARIVGEAVADTIGSTLTNVLQYPRGVLAELVRPSYWEPDAQGTKCARCSTPLSPWGAGGTGTNVPQTAQQGTKQTHHCRACGRAVCDDCSKKRRSVPERGWTGLVRVCNTCFRP